MLADDCWGRSRVNIQAKRAQHEPTTTPSLLVLGHVCRDRIGNQQRLGGAASFAARTAACLGVHTAVVTAAPTGFSLLEPLRHDPHLSLTYLPCPQETIFELDYSGPVRRLRVLHRAPDLSLDLIPARCLQAPLAYVCPIIGEVGRELVEVLQAQHVVAGAQGWMRALTPEGRLMPTVADELLHPPRNLTAAVFSEQDHPEAEALSEHLAQRGVLTALTRGRDGLTLYTQAGQQHIEASPATEVDPTGAGDVFGVVFALALQHGHDLQAAAHQAAFAAARVVEGPGLGNLPGQHGELVARTARQKLG